MANENELQNSGRETPLNTKKSQPKSEKQDKRTTKDIRRVTANTPAFFANPPHFYFLFACANLPILR